MPERRSLGEILREADLVTEEQLAEALRLQKAYGERLASILVRQLVITEKFAVTYLGRQIGVPGLDLSRSEVDLSLLDLVPLDTCQRNLVLPVRIEANRVQLAMSDPTDQKLVSHLEFASGARIQPLVALESSLKYAISEARKAVKAGQRTMTVNIQHHPVKHGQESPAPIASAGKSAAAAGVARREATPAAQARSVSQTSPVPVPAPRPPEPKNIVFETLAGAELSVKTPVKSSTALPAVQEMETVLVIDDSEVALKLIEAVLKSKRYRVLTARTGREGLAKMRETLPDLVILDGMLPEVHGFEICRHLKTSERFRHIPVVLLSAVHTGWRFASDVKEKYGADDYLTKPFESADLLRRVEALLNRPASSLPPQSEAAVRQHLKDGVVALKNDRLDEAIQCFERGLAVDQFNDMLHYYLAMTCEKRGRVFDAIDHYEKAVQVNPQFFDAITALANLYQRQEFWRKARELWELAMDATKDENVRARIKEHLLSLL